MPGCWKACLQGQETADFRLLYSLIDWESWIISFFDNSYSILINARLGFSTGGICIEQPAALHFCQGFYHLAPA